MWHVSDLPVVSCAGDKSPDDWSRDVSWRYEIFKWDAKRAGLCDAGRLMLMFSLEYKRIFAILSGLGEKKWRIRDVSSPGMTDKTIAKFESIRRLCPWALYSISRRRDYGLNAGHGALHEGCLLFSVLKNKSRALMVIFTKLNVAFLKKVFGHFKQ